MKRIAVLLCSGLLMLSACGGSEEIERGKNVPAKDGGYQPGSSPDAEAEMREEQKQDTLGTSQE